MFRKSDDFPFTRLLEDSWRDVLDVQIEQVDHSQVFRPRHSLQRADNRRRLGPAQDVS